MTLEQQKRLKYLVKLYGILLAVGLLYLVFVLVTSWRIPCIFNLIWGGYCPGCGVTRMCVALAKLDIKAAMGHNLLVFCLLPFLLGLLIYKSVVYVKKGNEAMTVTKAETAFYLIAFLLCILFTVLRNLPAYAWLAP